MRIHFQLILNSVTPPQPQRRERGRASPTQRCDAGTRGPERFCAPPSGGGHCRPRGVLRPAPCALFQLRAPGGCCASVRRSLAVPGPRHAWLRSADQTPRAEAGSGSTGPAGHPQVVVARARVCSPNECPRTPHPALRPARAHTSPLWHRQAPGTWSSGVDAAVPVQDPARNLGS